MANVSGDSGQISGDSKIRKIKIDDVNDLKNVLYFELTWDFILEDNRCLYLLFSRSWGGEDLDDNGIGICIRNEKIVEIVYNDIAF